jgi:hypothetical protein
MQMESAATDTLKKTRNLFVNNTMKLLKAFDKPEEAKTPTLHNTLFSQPL